MGTTQSYYFNEEHESFRQTIRQFLEKEAIPNIDQWELDGKIPREFWKKFGEMGYFGQEAAGQQANIANEMGRLQNSGFRGSKQMIPAILGAVMGKGGGGGGGGQQAPVGNQNYQNPSQGGGGVAGGMNTQYSGGSYGPPTQDQYYANNRRQ